MIMLVLHIFTWCYMIEVVRCPNELESIARFEGTCLDLLKENIFNQTNKSTKRNDRLCESGRFAL